MKMNVSRVKEILLRSSRPFKVLLVVLSDLISIFLATFFVFNLSNLNFDLLSNSEIIIIVWFALSVVLIFLYTGIYKTILRFINFSFLFLLIKSISLWVLLNLSLIYLYRNILKTSNLGALENLLNLDILVGGIFSLFTLIIGSRILANAFFSNESFEKNVVIYGAGSAGMQLAGALKASQKMKTIAFIDDDTKLQGNYIGEIKVFSRLQLKRLLSQKKVDEILIAMPSLNKSSLTHLLKEFEQYSLKVRILPSLYELASGKVLVSELKEVEITDLLGRYEVEPHTDLLDRNIRNKTVLITGAGGSIGSEISRQVTKNYAKKVILLDSNEFALFEIKKEIESYELDVGVYSVLANVTNKNKIKEVCKTFNVETIYHAAAYKHVSLVEENPFEAVFNNIFGTEVCVTAAIETNVETFVLVSTDKAVRPTNIMGATKRLSEMILQALSQETNNSITRMTMVRFGNVIGSSGSAIPLFQKQIKDGGPLTVTHKEVTRFFMSIPEAAELVIQAGALGKGGDVFLLDMGKPIKIIDLAKRLINLSGMEVKDESNPDGDIEIIFTGLKPGEKLYEELLIGDNVNKTKHKQIFRAEEDFLTKEKIYSYLDLMREAGLVNDVAKLKEILQEAIPGFRPEEEIVDVIQLHKKD